MRPTTPDAVLLTVRQLRTWFELRGWGFVRVGFVRAVDGVDFNLHRGEAVAVVGESGSGKSTLAKTILGLHRPHQGEIIFEGREVGGEKDLRRYRSRVGYVQQDPYGALPPFMNVLRILEEPLAINGEANRGARLRRIREVLDEVRLTPVEDFLSRFPHMLSGGQQQRLVVAPAMILKTQVIVADETLSILEASLRIGILQLLRGLHGPDHMSINYNTHDPANRP